MGETKERTATARVAVVKYIVEGCESVELSEKVADCFERIGWEVFS